MDYDWNLSGLAVVASDIAASTRTAVSKARQHVGGRVPAAAKASSELPNAVHTAPPGARGVNKRASKRQVLPEVHGTVEDSSGGSGPPPVDPAPKEDPGPLNVPPLWQFPRLLRPSSLTAPPPLPSLASLGTVNPSFDAVVVTAGEELRIIAACPVRSSAVRPSARPQVPQDTGLEALDFPPCVVASTRPPPGSTFFSSVISLTPQSTSPSSPATWAAATSAPAPAASIPPAVICAAGSDGSLSAFSSQSLEIGPISTLSDLSGSLVSSMTVVQRLGDQSAEKATLMYPGTLLACGTVDAKVAFMRFRDHAVGDIIAASGPVLCVCSFSACYTSVSAWAVVKSNVPQLNSQPNAGIVSLFDSRTSSCQRSIRASALGLSDVWSCSSVAVAGARSSLLRGSGSNLIAVGGDDAVVVFDVRRDRVPLHYRRTSSRVVSVSGLVMPVSDSDEGAVLLCAGGNDGSVMMNIIETSTSSSHDELGNSLRPKNGNVHQKGEMAAAAATQPLSMVTVARNSDRGSIRSICPSEDSSHIVVGGNGGFVGVFPWGDALRLPHCAHCDHVNSLEETGRVGGHCTVAAGLVNSVDYMCEDSDDIVNRRGAALRMWFNGVKLSVSANRSNTDDGSVPLATNESPCQPCSLSLEDHKISALTLSGPHLQTQIDNLGRTNTPLTKESSASSVSSMSVVANQETSRAIPVPGELGNPQSCSNAMGDAAPVGSSLNFAQGTYFLDDDEVDAESEAAPEVRSTPKSQRSASPAFLHPVDLYLESAGATDLSWNPGRSLPKRRVLVSQDLPPLPPLADSAQQAPSTIPAASGSPVEQSEGIADVTLKRSLRSRTVGKGALPSCFIPPPRAATPCSVRRKSFEAVASGLAIDLTSPLSMTSDTGSPRHANNALPLDMPGNKQLPGCAPGNVSSNLPEASPGSNADNGSTRVAGENKPFSHLNSLMMEDQLAWPSPTDPCKVAKFPVSTAQLHPQMVPCSSSPSPSSRASSDVVDLLATASTSNGARWVGKRTAGQPDGEALPKDTSGDFLPVWSLDAASQNPYKLAASRVGPLLSIPAIFAPVCSHGVVQGGCALRSQPNDPDLRSVVLSYRENVNPIPAKTFVSASPRGLTLPSEPDFAVWEQVRRGFAAAEKQRNQLSAFRPVLPGGVILHNDSVRPKASTSSPSQAALVVRALLMSRRHYTLGGSTVLSSAAASSPAVFDPWQKLRPQLIAAQIFASAAPSQQRPGAAVCAERIPSPASLPNPPADAGVDVDAEPCRAREPSPQHRRTVAGGNSFHRGSQQSARRSARRSLVPGALAPRDFFAQPPSHGSARSSLSQAPRHSSRDRPSGPTTLLQSLLGGGFSSVPAPI